MSTDVQTTTTQTAETQSAAATASTDTGAAAAAANTTTAAGDDISRIVSEQIAAALKGLDLDGKIGSKVSEAQKLANMDDRQRAEYDAAQRQQQLEQREREITARELKATATEQLQAKGLPRELADVLCYDDAETCGKSLESVSAAFSAAVEAAVNDRLKGTAPKAGTENTEVDKFVESARKAAGLK